jgi:hypothetical protein
LESLRREIQCIVAAHAETIEKLKAESLNKSDQLREAAASNGSLNDACNSHSESCIKLSAQLETNVV